MAFLCPGACEGAAIGKLLPSGMSFWISAAFFWGGGVSARLRLCCSSKGFETWVVAWPAVRCPPQ